ncbi:MAG TPA: response regulator [Ktedonobacterales bacterium]|nr:response regulator [Ktedonobacterales bacterium]
MTSAPREAPWRVLIVDDEENLNWSLVTSLRKDGYIVDGAHTGEEALARLQAAPYDCVVSDIKMPGMDGFELLQWLRQHHPATRTVMITSFGSPSARQDALREGAVAYFEKPFDLRALKDQLRRMVEAPALSSAAPEAGYDLLDVAQVISLARRDIALDVRGGGYTGVLRFLQGELLWAEAGDLRGDEAFLALCVPRGGHAQVAAWNGLTGRNVTQPLARLIYTALAQRERRTGAPARVATEPPAFATSPHAEPSHDAAPPETPTATASATAAIASDTAVSPPAADETAAPGAVTSPTTTDEDIAFGAPAAPSDDEPPLGDWAQASHPAGPAPADGHPPMPVPSLPDPEEAAREAGGGDLTAALEALADALPTPCGVAWLGTDAAMVWQRWRGQAEIPQPALAQLHMVVRAAGQASALGALGVLDELRIVSAERQVILRRGPRGGTLLLSLAPDADAGAVTAALRGTLGSLAG